MAASFGQCEQLLNLGIFKLLCHCRGTPHVGVPPKLAPQLVTKFTAVMTAGSLDATVRLLSRSFQRSGHHVARQADERPFADTRLELKRRRVQLVPEIGVGGIAGPVPAMLLHLTTGQGTHGGRVIGPGRPRGKQPESLGACGSIAQGGKTSPEGTKVGVLPERELRIQWREKPEHRTQLLERLAGLMDGPVVAVAGPRQESDELANFVRSQGLESTYRVLV